MNVNNGLQIGIIRWKSYPSDMHTRRVAKYLVNRGHDVHVLSQREGDQSPTENVDGVTVHRVAAKNDSPIRQFFYHIMLIDYKWYYNIRRFVSEKSFDILHVIDLFPLPTVYRAVPDDLPVVADLRELYLESLESHKEEMSWYQRFLRPKWRYRRMEKRCLRRADGYITESSTAADYYATRYGLDANSIVDIRCVPDLERLNSIESKLDPPTYPDEFVVTYAGKFTPQRDLRTLIRSIADLDDTSPPIRLLMVGDGPAYDGLVELASELGVSDRVEFTGWVSFERMFDYMAASDVGVCLCRPGNKDSEAAKPNKLFQYMFLGLPVIVSDLRAMRETVTKANSGLIVDPGDVDDLVEAISRLHRDEELAHELGQGGCRSVQEELHFPKEGQAILDLYKRVLKTQ